VIPLHASESPSIQVDRSSRTFVLAAIIILGISILGTVAYVIFEGMSLFDAAYQTIVVISTLGIRDSTTGPTGRIITFCLVIVGIGAVAFGFSLIMSVVVEGKLRTVLGRRRVTAKIANLRDHYIICGYGRMGRQVCSRLSKADRMVIVIEKNVRVTSLVENDGHLYVLGNAYEEAILESSGISHAAGLVTVLPSDADNVFVALTARELNTTIPIVSRAENSESISKLERAGATNVISPHDIGARRMASSLINPAFAQLVEAAADDEEVEVGDLIVAEHSPIDGQKLSQAGIREVADALIISVTKEDGKRIFNPASDLILQAGDHLFYIGTRGTAKRLADIVRAKE